MFGQSIQAPSETPDSKAPYEISSARRAKAGSGQRIKFCFGRSNTCSHSGILLVAFLIANTLSFAASLSAASEAEIESVFQRYVDAASKKDPNETIYQIHTQSPFFLITMQQIQQIFPLYEIEISLDRFLYLGADATDHFAVVDQSSRKVSGPPFQNNATRSVVVFRTEDEDWKIWSIVIIESTPID